MSDSERNYEEEIRKLHGQVGALQTILMEVWSRMLSGKPVDLSVEREALMGVAALHMPISSDTAYWRSFNTAIAPFQSTVSREPGGMNMDKFHYEGRLAAQRAFLVLATQRHPGSDLVGDFSPVLEAMGQLVERLAKYHKESAPEMTEFDEAQFNDGYLLERRLLTMMLSNYHDLFR